MPNLREIDRDPSQSQRRGGGPRGWRRGGRWTDGVPSLYIAVTREYIFPKNPRDWPDGLFYTE